MFPKTEGVSYKVLVTTKGGKSLTFNYIVEVRRDAGFFCLTGQEQNDGTMIRRDHVLSEDVVAMIDARVISSTRQPSTRQQMASEGQSAPAEEEVMF